MEGFIEMNKNPLESGRIDKLVLKFAIPCVIAMVVSALYNIVDQIFIGQGVGYIGNAATTVGFPLIVMAQGFALLFGDGAAAFYSIK
ncbi:MAG: MATE family efflux transporter, partial [Clostridium sp.]